MPSESDALEITPQVRIPMTEIVLTAISGGGPGGQHVNKSATRIALQWNVRTSLALREEQRERLLQQLASRLDTEGQLRIVAGEYRSQQQNRRAALERLQQLVARALVVPRVRRATKPSRGAVQERLTDKRKRAETKRQRRRDHDD
ncbi:MAG: aminoacyl-tRNA hydrolase [Gemmatimonadaceae bacterium]|nr:aminoacyl-tRNA hydrolase [Gemmatimonadaceae bacterium]